ncbi:MAG: bifunctional riboflavin kinase/FAD synthetase [Thiomonas sp.]|uniref:Bifunctional riboflavin kinase/FMN adenylyltransferase n=1 Tax=mine drainage metagenome TaxID=410659 RepID=E6PPR6_9ZZZZ
MQVFRGFHHAALATPSAVSIGNFDGVHRGHQAMLALLVSEARHRKLASCVLTFEPHPRDYFAAMQGMPDLAPARVAGLRDKLAELERCGIDRVVVLRFNQQLASLPAQDFIQQVLLDGLHARYVLVGDDFRFGAKRAGDYAMLDAQGLRLGFDVARLNAYEVHGRRVSSSAVRQALASGDMTLAASLLDRPYAISGHVQHGRKLGRTLGFPTLNLRLAHARPAARGIFAVRVHGLAEQPLDGVASLGLRPTVADSGRVLLETYVLDWAGDAYGKLVRVELLHKLRDEAHYDSLDALTAAIAADVQQARAWFAITRRHTSSSRI